MTDNITFLAILASGIIICTSLAWSNAFQALISYYYPDEKDDKQIKAKFVYAFSLTVFTIVIFYFIKFVMKKIHI